MFSDFNIVTRHVVFEKIFTFHDAVVEYKKTGKISANTFLLFKALYEDITTKSYNFLTEELQQDLFYDAFLDFEKYMRTYKLNFQGNRQIKALRCKIFFGTVIAHRIRMNIQ